MRRLLVIVLLALMPLQFSWAAVASYCEHETQAGAAHVGHHEHEHHADATGDGEPVDAAAKTDASADADGAKALGAMDLDCGSCHGHCSVMLMLAAGLPGTLATAPLCASVDGSAGGHAPTRPERPQWRPLA